MSNPFAVTETLEQPLSGNGKIRVKRVGVISLGVFLGAGTLVISGLVCFLGLAGLVLVGQIGGPEALGLIFLPILYGVGAFIAGCFYAIVYNVIAGMTGGIELEIGGR